MYLAELGRRTCSSAAERRHACIVCLLISPARLAQALISGCQDDDRNQGHYQRERSSDSPLGEDDTEVFGRPGEDHLPSSARVRVGQEGS